MASLSSSMLIVSVSCSSRLLTLASRFLSSSVKSVLWGIKFSPYTIWLLCILAFMGGFWGVFSEAKSV